MGDHTENPPDRLKMPTAGIVDRSTRQTIIATLDRADPSGNQAVSGPARPRPGARIRSTPSCGQMPDVDHAIDP